MNLTFRNLTDSDISFCLDILKENYPQEKYDYWKDFLLKDISDTSNKVYPSEFLVVIRDEVIIGFGAYLQLHNQNTTYKLTWINIPPKEQGKGIGRQLVTELEKRIKEYNKGKCTIILETDKPIFYNKLGYATYYKKEDGEMMVKSMP